MLVSEVQSQSELKDGADTTDLHIGCHDNACDKHAGDTDLP